jgi:hypothetical protein
MPTAGCPAVDWPGVAHRCSRALSDAGSAGVGLTGTSVYAIWRYHLGTLATRAYSDACGTWTE